MELNFGQDKHSILHQGLHRLQFTSGTAHIKRLLQDGIICHYKPHPHPNCITYAAAIKVLLPNLLILEDIYHYQNSLLYHPGAVHTISSQSVWKKLKGFGTVHYIVNVQQHN